MNVWDHMLLQAWENRVVTVDDLPPARDRNVGDIQAVEEGPAFFVAVDDKWQQPPAAPVSVPAALLQDLRALEDERVRTILVRHGF